MNNHSQTTNTSYVSMLEEARERQNQGDLTGALNELRNALDRARESHVVTTLEQHLRVPTLLFQLGRREEAVSRFAKLLTEGYPDQLENENIRWLERGLVYETMRDVFDEAGEHKQAALADALAYLADAYGRFLDSHRKDYRHRLKRLSHPAVQSRADRVTARLDHPSEASDVAEILESAVDAFTPDNGARVIQQANRELASLLETEPLPPAA